ncbi:MAG: transposase [Lachnospiraceae bacterium]|jgi:transposase|nr:transposase [Lachnospiraceae bacterium]
MKGEYMPSTTIHNKADGKKYLYSVVSYWDKEKKQARNRQVCLGRIDETTGEVIPSARTERVAKRAAVAPEVTANATVVGPAMLLDAAVAETNLGNILARSIPEYHSEILSLAYFLVQRGLPLSRCESWSTHSKHPFGKPFSSQRISEILQGITEGQRQSFFKSWMKSLAEKECLFYDITSISSYSASNEYVRFGHNRDNENLPQINLALLFGQESGLPAYYRRIPGSISDVATLKTTVSSLDFLGQTRLMFVMDRGFYSKANVDALLDARYHFILAVPRRKWIEEIYDRERDDIMTYPNRCTMSNGEVLYAKGLLHKWGDRRCYVYIYYNHIHAAEDVYEFEAKLTAWRQELLSGDRVKENEWAYAKFFTVKETPKRGRKVVEIAEAVDSARKKYVGFSCLLSTKKMNPADALEEYRRKEAVENSYDDLKNALDMRRLRIHSSAAMDSRLFIQFIALILFSWARSKAKVHKATKYMTVREIMEAMESVTLIEYSGRYGNLITESGPLQRDIMEAYGLNAKS